MATLRPKDIVPLGQQIMDAESHLASLRARWEILLSGDSRSVKSQPDDASTRAMSANGFPAKVLAYVDASPGEVFTIAKVASGVGEDEVRTGKVLSRLAREKRIANPSRARYQSLLDVQPSADTEKEVASEEGTS